MCVRDVVSIVEEIVTYDFVIALGGGKGRGEGGRKGGREGWIVRRASSQPEERENRIDNSQQ